MFLSYCFRACARRGTELSDWVIMLLQYHELSSFSFNTNINYIPVDVTSNKSCYLGYHCALSNVGGTTIAAQDSRSHQNSSSILASSQVIQTKKVLSFSKNIIQESKMHISSLSI